MTRNEPTPAQRDAKQQRVMAAGRALAAGDPSMKPLNPHWDRRWMDGLDQGLEGLQALCRMDELSIEREAGRSAHEPKSWLVARSALSDGLATSCTFRHYQAIPKYIAGFGILLMQQTGSS